MPRERRHRTAPTATEIERVTTRVLEILATEELAERRIHSPRESPQDRHYWTRPAIWHELNFETAVIRSEFKDDDNVVDDEMN